MKYLSDLSQRTYCFHIKTIEKFDSVVPNGERSKTIEKLISQYLEKNSGANPSHNTTKTNSRQRKEVI